MWQPTFCNKVTGQIAERNFCSEYINPAQVFALGAETATEETASWGMDGVSLLGISLIKIPARELLQLRWVTQWPPLQERQIMRVSFILQRQLSGPYLLL